MKQTQKEKYDNIALSYMESCEKILDIGCGTGRFISFDPERIEGIDQNEENVKTCKSKGFKVKTGQATMLPFGDNAFDAVHCSHLIEHLNPYDAYELLSEMNRVLKTDGIFCIRGPLMNSKFYDDLTHVRPYTPRAILHYMQIEENEQRALSKIPRLYEQLLLKYRKKTTRFMNIPIGKTGFMLILKKIN